MLKIDCDRFQTCSANICPLDVEWQTRKHLNGDRICFYLIQVQKSNAKALFDTCGRGYLYTVMKEVTPAIISRHNTIKLVLERAKITNSRMGRKIGLCHE